MDLITFIVTGDLVLPIAIFIAALGSEWFNKNPFYRDVAIFNYIVLFISFIWIVGRIIWFIKNNKI